jgi:transcriptional regulator with XRE-family HTH domain
MSAGGNVVQITEQTPDAVLLRELGLRLEQTRLNRNVTQEDLAREAGISRQTLARIEQGGEAKLSSFIRVLRALGLLEGLEALVRPPVPSPIEQLHLAGHERKRARARGSARPPASGPWQWE